MSDLRGQQLKDSYQDVITDSGSDLAGIENGNGIDITGRIVERGSNSDGEFVRFADGTQICQREVSFPLNSSGSIGFSFPANFDNTVGRVTADITFNPDDIAWDGTQGNNRRRGIYPDILFTGVANSSLLEDGGNYSSQSWYVRIETTSSSADRRIHKLFAIERWK